MSLRDLGEVIRNFDKILALRGLSLRSIVEAIRILGKNSLPEVLALPAAPNLGNILSIKGFDSVCSNVEAIRILGNILSLRGFSFLSMQQGEVMVRPCFSEVIALPAAQ